MANTATKTTSELKKTTTQLVKPMTCKDCGAMHFEYQLTCKRCRSYLDRADMPHASNPAIAVVTILVVATAACAIYLAMHAHLF
jgi:hypothetical protein